MVRRGAAIGITMALAILGTTLPVQAQDTEERPRQHSDRDALPGWQYASGGLQYRSADGRWLQRFTLRNQIRLTSTSSADEERATIFDLNRSRLKFTGHLGSPRLENDVEIDLKNSRMYHFFATLHLRDAVEVRAGQWKVEFNRERVDSSGAQQLVDRSIVNADFTLDGQIGAMVRGRLFKGHAADANYFVGLLAGEGRLAWNDDDVPMVLGRYQWNLARRSVGFSQSDVEYHPQTAAAIGIAAARGRGRYTAYSSDGGTQLDGFDPGLPGQYELRQWMTDIALFRRGLSLQGEHHWKRVIDHVNGGGRRLRGGYLQSGFFPVQDWSRRLSALELAGRIAYVDPDLADREPNRREYTGGVNWYFNQHRNKISFDVSRLTGGGSSPQTRLRLQWDLSL